MVGGHSETIPATNGTRINVLDAFNSGGAGVNSNGSTNRVEIADNFDFNIGTKHQMRVGLLVDHSWYSSFDQRNADGTCPDGSTDTTVFENTVTCGEGEDAGGLFTLYVADNGVEGCNDGDGFPIKGRIIATSEDGWPRVSIGAKALAASSRPSAPPSVAGPALPSASGTTPRSSIP